MTDKSVRADGLDDKDFLARLPEAASKLGSNAVALGADATDNGRGMLLGNPHFPWVGNLRFYQFHVTVPGQIDVMGGSLSGLPLIIIGFNKDVAWSHTVDMATTSPCTSSTLDPTNPLKYVYDGQTRDMTSKTVTVQVKQADGSLVPVEQDLLLDGSRPADQHPAAARLDARRTPTRSRMPTSTTGAWATSGSTSTARRARWTSRRHSSATWASRG